eukprot:TRINITY_DN1216_c0_g1_i2.p1 TRINITY_DN1216_c0_g1~~TRINITY_DN1216_c0_g1_i2.p1  ORF type:complete len:451 (+),score=171.28 TRINITY_DN1216_c0_g1_i2:104-1456(+)
MVKEDEKAQGANGNEKTKLMKDANAVPNSGTIIEVKKAEGVKSDNSGWGSESGGRTKLLFQIFIGLSVLSVVVLLGFMGYTFHEGIWKNDQISLWCATWCCVVSTVFTGFQIHLHLTTYTNPPQQKKIIRILLIVPVYACTSLAALKFYKDAAIYINLVRDSYEAFVLFTFFDLMIDFLGGYSKAAKKIRKSGHETMKHPAPLCCFADFKITRGTIVAWQCCIMQYVLLKPLIALIAVICKAAGKYDEEDMFDYSDSYPWLLLFENISVTIAFTCLFYFYLASKYAIHEHNPTGKFIAIKIVVFLCFWQGVFISLLVKEGVIHNSKNGSWTKDQVATGMQDFLVCIEMVIVTVLHKKAFSHVPYLPESGIRAARVKAKDVKDAVIDVRDVHQHHVGCWEEFIKWCKYKLGIISFEEFEICSSVTSGNGQEEQIQHLSDAEQEGSEAGVAP